MCRLSVRPVDSAGEMTKATLPTWRVDQLARHDRFFLRPTSQLPRRIIHGDAAKIAHRADFSSAPVYVLVSGHGDSAKATTPLNWFANVAFRLPARVSPRGRTQCRCCRNAPSAQCPLRCLFSPLDGVDSSGAKTEPTVAKQHRRPTSLPRSVSVPSERRKPHWVQIAEASPKAAMRLEVRKSGSSEVFRMGSELQRINNQGDTGNVARVRIGSP